MYKTLEKPSYLTFLFFILMALALLLAPDANAKRLADKDRDKLPDRWEIRNHISPKRKSTFQNFDRDALTNRFEFMARMNPRRADSDHDGLKDSQEDTDNDGLTNEEEQLLHMHPRRADSNRDGTEDGAEDKDEDGVTNEDEFESKTDPISACSDDEDFELELRREYKLGKELKFVLSWYVDADDYFDGKADDDCENDTAESDDIESDDDAEEAEEDDAAGGAASEDELATLI